MTAREASASLEPVWMSEGTDLISEPFFESILYEVPNGGVA